MRKSIIKAGAIERNGEMETLWLESAVVKVYVRQLLASKEAGPSK